MGQPRDRPDEQLNVSSSGNLTQGGSSIPNEPPGRRNPHPCTLPPPERTGVTCVTYAFLICDHELPRNYPYDYQRTHGNKEGLPRSKEGNFDRVQIPFFCFSGPDPPPADIGSLGDLYIAPEASALYAYLPNDDLFTEEDGAWTRWSASGPGPLVPHPYFPGRLLWADHTSFSWCRPDVIDRVRSEPLQRDIFAVNAGEAATKVLIELMVRKNEEYRTLLEKSTSKRVRADNGAGPRKKPRCTRENLLEEANKALKASLDERSTTVASLDAELRKRMETISGLIEDKARQQKSLAEQAITIKRLHDEASDAAATITRLGTEKTAMSVIVDDTMRENKALKGALAREEEPRPTMQTQRTQTDLDDARPTRAELEALLLRERQDAAQRTAQHNVAIQAAEATIRGLRDATKVLLAEIDRVSGQ